MMLKIKGSIWLTFYFMVVGTQDKGHKVSNVQVMPLLTGCSALWEGWRSQTVVYRG